MDAKEVIVGVNFDEVKKAYPIDQLGWKIINDKVGNENIVVITRPKLTSVFFPEVDGEILEFAFVDDIDFNQPNQVMIYEYNGSFTPKYVDFGCVVAVHHVIIVPTRFVRTKEQRWNKLVQELGYKEEQAESYPSTIKRYTKRE